MSIPLHIFAMMRASYKSVDAFRYLDRHDSHAMLFLVPSWIHRKNRGELVGFVLVVFPDMTEFLQFTQVDIWVMQGLNFKPPVRTRSMALRMIL